MRRPWRALSYEAMRAVLRRANTVLATNWTLHDLRHTAALRMADDPDMPLVDIQTLLGHPHLSTTERYLRLRLEQVRQHHQRQTERPRGRPARPPSATTRRIYKSCSAGSRAFDDHSTRP
ncbi:tyrosine-type recombinase/integrase [Nocardia australiensis]|uniref:tyrosine-type recombinase/integrase n=1 Tax=Nocardia australiensis TaxID=2887191 RepID=UPI001D148DB2|nr:tyrosine-type recombinase/integrase [Nocardia australiensis]